MRITPCESWPRRLDSTRLRDQRGFVTADAAGGEQSGCKVDQHVGGKAVHLSTGEFLYLSRYRYGGSSRALDDFFRGEQNLGGGLVLVVHESRAGGQSGQSHFVFKTLCSRRMRHI